MRITVNETTVPAPSRATGCHSRWWPCSQNSLGGIASAPHRPQRMPVRCPARASSKKSFRWTTRSVTAEQAHQHGRGVAAQRVGEPGGGSVDLPLVGLAAELGDDLRDLGGPGRADRMPLGLEAAGRVHRELAPEAGPALLGRETTGARLEEAESFGGHDLGDREAVVQLHHVDVCGSLARLPVSPLRGALGGGDAREVALLVHEHGVAGCVRSQDPDRPPVLAGDLLGCQHDGRAPVGERAAVVELEGIGHVGALEHGFERDLLLELGLRIERAVAVVLDRHVGHLLLGGSVLVHVGARDQGEDAGEGEARGLLERGVRAVGEELGRGLGRHVEHPLCAPDQDHVRHPARDLHDRVPERDVAGRAGVLEASGGNVGQAQQRGGQRGHVQLPLGLTAGDVAEVERLDRARGDARVEDGVGAGLREQLGAGAIVLAKLGDAHSDDGNAAHAVSSGSAKIANRSLVASYRAAPRELKGGSRPGKSSWNAGGAWYGGPHDAGPMVPRSGVTVEEALLALLAGVAIGLLFLGLADALEGDVRARLRARRRALARRPWTTPPNGEIAPPPWCAVGSGPRLGRWWSRRSPPATRAPRAWASCSRCAPSPPRASSGACAARCGAGWATRRRLVARSRRRVSFSTRSPRRACPPRRGAGRAGDFGAATLAWASGGGAPGSSTTPSRRSSRPSRCPASTTGGAPWLGICWSAPWRTWRGSASS